MHDIPVGGSLSDGGIRTHSDGYCVYWDEK